MIKNRLVQFCFLLFINTGQLFLSEQDSRLGTLQRANSARELSELSFGGSRVNHPLEFRRDSSDDEDVFALSPANMIASGVVRRLSSSAAADDDESVLEMSTFLAQTTRRNVRSGSIQEFKESMRFDSDVQALVDSLRATNRFLVVSGNGEVLGEDDLLVESIDSFRLDSDNDQEDEEEKFSRSVRRVYDILGRPEGGSSVSTTVNSPATSAAAVISSSVVLSSAGLSVHHSSAQRLITEEKRDMLARSLRSLADARPRRVQFQEQSIPSNPQSWYQGLVQAVRTNNLPGFTILKQHEPVDQIFPEFRQYSIPLVRRERILYDALLVGRLSSQRCTLNSEIFKELVQMGFTKNIRDAQGKGLLEIALMSGRPDLAVMLLDTTLSPVLLLGVKDFRDHKDNSFMHLAAAFDYLQLVNLLNARGLHNNAVNNDGLRPSDVARRAGHEDIAIALESIVSFRSADQRRYLSADDSDSEDKPCCCCIQ